MAVSCQTKISLTSFSNVAKPERARSSRRGAFGAGETLAEMAITGTYPMLYAFFDAEGRLRREAFARQIAASIKAGASGIAVLGLGTETGKLSRDERRVVVDWVMEDVGGRVPLAVTIA